MYSVSNDARLSPARGSPVRLSHGRDGRGDSTLAAIKKRMQRYVCQELGMMGKRRCFEAVADGAAGHSVTRIKAILQILFLARPVSGLERGAGLAGAANTRQVRGIRYLLAS